MFVSESGLTTLTYIFAHIGGMLTFFVFIMHAKRNNLSLKMALLVASISGIFAWATIIAWLLLIQVSPVIALTSFGLPFISAIYWYKAPIVDAWYQWWES